MWICPNCGEIEEVITINEEAVLKEYSFKSDDKELIEIIYFEDYDMFESRQMEGPLCPICRDMVIWNERCNK